MGAALVTGAGRRIGRAIALDLAEAGFDVCIHHHRSAEAAEAVAADIRARGRRAATVAADLAQDAEVRSLIPRAAEALGPLSLLVNSAAVFADDRVGGLTRETWDRHLAVNLRAPVVLAETFAEQAADGALVVNLLDQRVLKPNPQFFSYGLSKSALATATRMLAQALAPRVRVNGVAPGPTLASVHQAPGEFEAETAATPLGHAVDPAEIARAVRYLVDSPSVTGQILAVDSGQHLAWRTPDIVHD